MALNRYEMFPVNAPHEFLLETFDTDGTKANLDAAPTYEVTNGAGGTVTSGTASTNGNSGEYTFTTLATAVDIWTVTWSGDQSGTAVTYETYGEPVGAELFTEQQFRAFAGDLFSSESNFTDADIRAARDAAAEQLEAWTGISWIPRYCRAQFGGNNLYELRLGDGYARTSSGKVLDRPGRNGDVRQILSATVDGSSVSTSDLTIMGGYVHRSSYWPYPTRDNRLNITLEWEYGRPFIQDGVDRIAMLLAKDRLRETIVSDRATSFTDDLGTYRFDTPGKGGSVSNIPEVNEWVKSHRVNWVMVG